MGKSLVNQTPTDPAQQTNWQGLSTSPSTTHALGALLASHLKPGDVIALIGELGAGKTQLVRGIAQGMNIDPTTVTSPTFVLMHEYNPPANPNKQPRLIHIDAYRITGPEDLASIGWELATSPLNSNHPSHPDPNVLGDLATNAVVIIEWADRIADHLPTDHLQITLHHHAEHERWIELTATAPRWSTAFPTLVNELNHTIKRNETHETN